MGILLTALLSSITWVISQNVDTGKHLVKIDTLLEMQGNQVPRVVEEKFEELRARINMNEQRLNNLDDRNKK